MNRVYLAGKIIKSPHWDGPGRWRMVLTVPEQPAGPIPVYICRHTRGPVHQLREGYRIEVTGFIAPHFRRTPAGPMIVLEVTAVEVKPERGYSA